MALLERDGALLWLLAHSCSFCGSFMGSDCSAFPGASTWSLSVLYIDFWIRLRDGGIFLFKTA